MKKLLWILAFVPLLASCSKNNEDSNLNKEYQWVVENIDGTWSEISYYNSSYNSSISIHPNFRSKYIFKGNILDIIESNGETKHLSFEVINEMVTYIVIDGKKYLVASVNEQEEVITLYRYKQLKKCED